MLDSGLSQTRSASARYACRITTCQTMANRISSKRLQRTEVFDLPYSTWQAGTLLWAGHACRRVALPGAFMSAEAAPL